MRNRNFSNKEQSPSQHTVTSGRVLLSDLRRVPSDLLVCVDVV